MTAATDTNPDPATEDFARVTTFTSAPTDVVDALITPQAIAAWWGPTTGSAAAGGRFVVDFDEGRRTSIEVAAVEPQRVEWTVLSAPHHSGEWDGTTISFDLAPAGAGTELRFRHRGLTPQLGCYERCEAGWTHFLGSLGDYVDTGRGHPYGRD
jgi:uncharacterized protein YndB with AHSA1/START domain